jgi:glycosyltransferase involved in cell wall biosynthesis
MRIAYFAYISGGGHSGVYHKVVGQAAAWQRQGHHVRAFILTRDEPEVWRAGLKSAHVQQFAGPLSRLVSMSRLSAGVRAYRPDLVYLRYFPFYPTMLTFLLRMPVVVEVNTDDLTEFVLGSRLRSTYNGLSRGVILGRARAIVFVTQELSASPSFSRFSSRHEVITNGVDLAEYPELPLPHGGRPRLAFVGSAGQPWQGFDKVARMAALRPEWAFDIVGAPDPGGSATNITWHGTLDRAGVLATLAEAHVGIGTLALHRKKLEAASPLKVREYLAVGLPVLYAYDDADLEGLGEYSLRIANDETNVEDELDHIDRLVSASMDLRVPRSSIQHLDVSAKERQRLELFEAVVEM